MAVNCTKYGTEKLFSQNPFVYEIKVQLNLYIKTTQGTIQMWSLYIHEQVEVYRISLIAWLNGFNILLSYKSAVQACVDASNFPGD